MYGRKWVINSLKYHCKWIYIGNIHIVHVRFAYDIGAAKSLDNDDTPNTYIWMALFYDRPFILFFLVALSYTLFIWISRFFVGLLQILTYQHKTKNIGYIYDQSTYEIIKYNQLQQFDGRSALTNINETTWPMNNSDL